MKIINIIKSIQFILMPRYWIMNHKYSKDLDNLLIRLMANNRFEYIDSHTVKIGGIIFWIANHPYASFTIYSNNKKNPKSKIHKQYRPSRLTIKKAMRKYIKDTNHDCDLFNINNYINE